MAKNQNSSGIDRLVASIVQWAGMGSLIIEHMAQSARLAPANAPDAQGTFTRLLQGTLAPLADRHAASDLDAAATVMADAIETIADELLLVDLG
jgi:hypothetical protein